MDIQSKDRATLKSFFRKNLTPTETNFADLVDAQINQRDDGIVKPPGDPLCVGATGDASGPQRVLNFYRNLSDANPAWTLQLNPRSVQDKPNTARAGFSISDGQGSSRLFIDSSGAVGIGTISPSGMLDIANVVRFGLDEGNMGSRTISFLRDPADEINSGKICYKGGFGEALNIVGAGTNATNRRVQLTDNVTVSGSLQVNDGINSKDAFSIIETKSSDWLRINPSGQYPGILLQKAVAIQDGGLFVGGGQPLPGGHLKVSGPIYASSSNTPPAKDASGVPSATTGIRFLDDPGGGSSDAAWIQYYARSAEHCTLELGIANDAEDHIALMPSGNVGIGTTSPRGKLEIDLANAKVWQGNTTAIRLSSPDPNYSMDVNAYVIESGNVGYHFSPSKQGTAAMGLVIDTYGNVGIGAAPQKRMLSIGADDVRGLGFETGASPNAGLMRFGDNTGWKLHFGRSREAPSGALNTGSKGVLMTIVDNGKVGIGVDDPVTTLDLDGSFAMTGALTPSSTKSTSLERLPIGGYLAPWTVYFSAYVATNDLNDARDPLPLKVTSNNRNSCFDVSTSKFTAPVTGVYLFTMHAIRSDGGTEWLHWYLKVNGDYANKGEPESSERCLLSWLSSNVASSRTIILPLAKGDTVHIQQAGKGRCDNFRSGLEGILIYAEIDLPPLVFPIPPVFVPGGAGGGTGIIFR